MTRQSPTEEAACFDWVDWGSAPDWAGALFTGGGLAAAVYQLQQARREQERARDRARGEEADRQEAEARALEEAKQEEAERQEAMARAVG